MLQTHNLPYSPLMNAFINGIKWQKRNDSLKTISRRYCNHLYENPYSSLIKESPTATFWSIYINFRRKWQKVCKPLAKTLLFTCWLFSTNLWQRHQRNFGQHPTGVPLLFLSFFVLSGLPSKSLPVGRPCWFLHIINNITKINKYNLTIMFMFFSNLII